MGSVLKIETDCSSEIHHNRLQKIGSNYDYDQRQWVSLSILKTSPLFFQSNSNIILLLSSPTKQTKKSLKHEMKSKQKKKKKTKKKKQTNKKKKVKSMNQGTTY